jgi:hypothetical protein
MNIKNTVAINDNDTKINISILHDQILLNKYALYLANITLKIFENIGNIDVGEYETFNPNFKLRIEEIESFQLNSANVTCTLYGYSTDFSGNRDQYYEITYTLLFALGTYNNIHLCQIRQHNGDIMVNPDHASDAIIDYIVSYLESMTISYAEGTNVDSFEFLEL